jgi:hypothetical protein
MPYITRFSRTPDNSYESIEQVLGPDGYEDMQFPEGMNVVFDAAAFARSTGQLALAPKVELKYARGTFVCIANAGQWMMFDTATEPTDTGLNITHTHVRPGFVIAHALGRREAETVWLQPEVSVMQSISGLSEDSVVVSEGPMELTGQKLDELPNAKFERYAYAVS